jgi:hypothetical protein
VKTVRSLPEDSQRQVDFCKGVDGDGMHEVAVCNAVRVFRAR